MTTVLKIKKELKAYKVFAQKLKEKDEIRQCVSGLTAVEKNFEKKYWLWHVRFGHFGGKGLH